MKVLSLFCGCGGLDFGFHEHPSFSVLKSYDKNANAVHVYNLNYPGTAEVLNVPDIILPEFSLHFKPNIIIGGPPCQEFSAARGKHKTPGERANMSTVFRNAVLRYMPEFFVMENVPQMLTTRGGKDIHEANVQAFREGGYGLTVLKVKMSEYNVPQTRQRLIIIGRHGGSDNEFVEEMEREKAPVISMQDYMQKNDRIIDFKGKKYAYIRRPFHKDCNNVFCAEDLCPTVTTVHSPLSHLHSKDKCQDKNLILEDPQSAFFAAIQTFPPSFDFGDLHEFSKMKLIGNAVPPAFSTILARVIADFKN